MKKIFLFALITLYTASSLNSNQLLGQDATKKLPAEKTFSVNADADLLVNHEYGNVICNNWDKNDIAITITAYTKTKDAEKAEKAFSRVSWDLKGNSNEVIVESKLSGKGGRNSSNVWVDIEITMPESINLNFSQKFGKAFIESVTGVALITSDYGSININHISNPESKLKVTYGDGQVNKFMGNSIGVQYGKLNFDKAGDVSIRSDYSDVEGDQADNILIKLEGGNLNLDEVISIKGSSSFSSLNIDRLKSSIDVETGYGSLNIDNVSEAFTEVNIENNFGSVNIGIPSSVSYVFDANSNHGSIIYPEAKANLTYREKTTQKEELRGVIGDNSNTKSRVTLKTNYGSINITK